MHEIVHHPRLHIDERDISAERNVPAPRRRSRQEPHDLHRHRDDSPAQLLGQNFVDRKLALELG